LYLFFVSGYSTLVRSLYDGDQEVIHIKLIRNNLGDISHLHRTASRLLGIGEHDHAKWAADCQGLGAGSLGFSETVGGDALNTCFFFFPHLCATRPAAKRFGAMARHLGDFCVDQPQCLARFNHDTILPAEITGIVKCNF
jgi:hypothetical protein